MKTDATILGSADSTHYLVGKTDLNGNLLNLSELSSIAICNSISEAKALLRSYDYNSAALKLQSPYDEMCGTEEYTKVTTEHSIRL